MMLAVLGRQPEIGIAELERRFGSAAVSWCSDSSALVDADAIDIQSLGSTVKLGRVVERIESGDWPAASQRIVDRYTAMWADRSGKQTLGISAYGFDRLVPRTIQKTGLVLKTNLKKAGVSLRLIPNSDVALSSATSHHNKLGLSNTKTELLIVRQKNGAIVIAESVGAQNISALARRDQQRPKRDAFVGMLPPKLALTIVNLATGTLTSGRVLDPFCGTGVVLQEAALRGFSVYGTDLSEKMIDYTRANLDWLATTNHLDIAARLTPGDATTTRWQPPIDSVACETYLGQPFSAFPAPEKLRAVRTTCDRIVAQFLENIAAQLPSGTELCVAVPAWQQPDGRFAQLPLLQRLDSLGFRPIHLKNTAEQHLIYARPDQVVARQLLLLQRV